MITAKEILTTAILTIMEHCQQHPAYADLTPEQECEIGGDTADFSYLVRVCRTALELTE